MRKTKQDFGLTCGKICGCQRPYKDVYVPKKQPRYCKYAVPHMIWVTDLRNYNMHRKKIFEAKSMVDTKPLPVNLDLKFKHNKLRDNNTRQFEIDRQNKVLLQTLVEIGRKGGALKTTNDIINLDFSKSKEYDTRMEKMNKENQLIYKKLTTTRSFYSKAEAITYWTELQKKVEPFRKVPMLLYKKTTLDDRLLAEPSISGNMSKMGTRPECFIEFQVEGGEYLGKIIVELYSDHVPVTVENFIGILGHIHDLSFKNCPVHRIVRDRFMETGDITKGTGKGGYSIFGQTFDEENHKLSHTKAGVLSMSRINSEQKNNSIFCITFKNMQQLDKKNVVFGRVTRGAHVLNKINSYGRSIGKPLEKIYISDCGEIPTCICADKNCRLSSS